MRRESRFRRFVVFFEQGQVGLLGRSVDAPVFDCGGDQGFGLLLPFLGLGFTDFGQFVFSRFRPLFGVVGPFGLGRNPAMQGDDAADTSASVASALSFSNSAASLVRFITF